MLNLYIEWNLDEAPEAEALKEVNSTVEAAGTPGVDPADMETLWRTALEAALAAEEVTIPVEIGLSVVEEEEIQSVNREHRSIDAVTDVLSFPMLEYDPQEAPALRVARAMAEGDVDPETDEVYLGDIMICLKRAKEQALEFGHSLQRELAFLAVHSLLHLLGYDHMTPEEEKVMFGKQEAVLQSIGLRRE